MVEASGIKGANSGKNFKLYDNYYPDEFVAYLFGRVNYEKEWRLGNDMLDIRTSHKDVDAVAKWIKTFGFKDKNIHKVREPTEQDVLDKIKEIKKMMFLNNRGNKSKYVVFIYFSGHGCMQGGQLEIMLGRNEFF